MADVITAEIVREYLETVCAEMSTVIENTTVATGFNSSHDYSQGVFYYDGQRVNLLARQLSEPVHIYAAVTSVEALLEFFQHDLHEGDVILAMDPYYGGSHLFDWTIMKPVFYKGKPIFFPSVRGHFTDVGGPVPGGQNHEAEEMWQEGFRVAPIKLYEKGEIRRDVWDLVMANNRLATTAEHDLHAMVGACRVGERRIRELFDRYGTEKVLDSVAFNLDYSERRLRAEIARWPDGEYCGRSILDHDCAGTRDINVDARLIVHGDSVTVDFTGSHPQVRGIVNSPPGNTASYVYMQFTALFPDIPVNSGLFRPVDIVMPRGTVVNPDPPANTATCTLHIGCDIGQAVMKALEHVAPEQVGCAIIDWLSVKAVGRKRHHAERFVDSDFYATAISSGGAYGADGWGAWSAPHSALKLPPLELLELVHPYIYFQSEFGTDTAAPGQWRGAPALLTRRLHESPVDIRLRVQKARHPVVGYAGGRPGVGNYVVVNQGTDQEQVIYDTLWPELTMPAGSVLFIQKAGGGGWGDPLARDPALVVRDVLDELVSVEGARRDYGVVVDPDTLTLDADATDALRQRLRDAAQQAASLEVSQP
jgi:N-methylhydantoinase B